MNTDLGSAPKLSLLALLRRERTQVRVALLVAATLLACGKSPANRSARAGEQTDFSAPVRGHLKGDSPPSERRLSTFSSVTQVNEQDPIEELEWLTAAREDPDPSLRAAALENWARDPGETLDPVTHALVDPDELVRERAQGLLEEALARR